MGIHQRKFYDANNKDKFLKVKKSHGLKLIKIELNGEVVYIDKTTAIKYAKTIRTEINKIKEVDHE